MARRRNIAGALAEMAARNNAFLEILFRQQMEKERMTMQDRLIRDRDRESADRGLLTSLTQNTSAIPLMVRGGRTELAGADLTKMLPTDAEIAGPLFEDIQKSTTPGTEPTGTELLGRYRGKGGSEDPHFQGPFPTVMGKEQVGIPTPEVRTPIADLMRARAAREAANLGEVQRQAEWGPRYDEESRRNVVGAPGSAVPQAPTPEQAGENVATTLRTGELSPGITRLKAGQAGAIAGASASASETAQIRARHANRNLIAEVERAVAEARATGKPAGQRNTAVIMKIGEDMIKMSEQLNTKDWGPAAIGQGMRDRFEAMIQTDPVAKKLRDDRKGYTPLFARLFGHTGVLTQQDVDSTMSVLPDYGLTTEVSKNRNATFKTVLQAGQTIGDTLGAIDPNLSPEEQSAIFQERLAAAIAAGKGGELVFEVGPDGVMRAVVK